ncbi:probable MICOS complex subunit mic10 [Coccomyxa sp. Obi]|nr:probable MICOS complex subunit mic10 [Coccomyxa sp. Obi]
MSSSERPPEFYINEKWDKCIDIALRRVVYGSLGGGVAALILFRGGGARAACLGFGAGFGAGAAYTECQRELRDVLGVKHQ